MSMSPLPRSLLKLKVPYSALPAARPARRMRCGNRTPTGMIQRRAAHAGIKTRIGNHTFRATGITAYLKNKCLLEHAQTLANHSSPRTTKLYDRQTDDISLDEVEKIAI